MVIFCVTYYLSVLKQVTKPYLCDITDIRPRDLKFIWSTNELESTNILVRGQSIIARLEYINAIILKDKVFIFQQLDEKTEDSAVSSTAQGPIPVTITTTTAAPTSATTTTPKTTTTPATIIGNKCINELAPYIVFLESHMKATAKLREDRMKEKEAKKKAGLLPDTTVKVVHGHKMKKPLLEDMEDHMPFELDILEVLPSPLPKQRY